MTRPILGPFSAIAAGIVFGVGLVVSGMARPSKVLGFLTLSSAWDPSLLFVMAGAVAVHALAYTFKRRLAAPLAATEFAVPPRRRVNPRVLGGAAVFGVGWGLSGFCPGPSVVALPSGSLGTVIFVATFFIGSYVAAKLTRGADGARPMPAVQKSE